MRVDELLPMRRPPGRTGQAVEEGKVQTLAVRRVEIPKEEKGKSKRKLGIPTVVDRMIQQAIAQELALSTNGFRKTATRIPTRQKRP